MNKRETGTQSSRSIYSNISGDDEFDDDVALASPYTWVGRRVNALVRAYRDVDDGTSSAGSSFDEGEGGDGKISSHIIQTRNISNGYAIVSSKSERRRLKFRRKFIMMFTWILLGLNLVR